MLEERLAEPGSQFQQDAPLNQDDHLVLSSVQQRPDYSMEEPSNVQQTASVLDKKPAIQSAVDQDSTNKQEHPISAASSSKKSDFAKRSLSVKISDVGSSITVPDVTATPASQSLRSQSRMSSKTAKVSFD